VLDEELLDDSGIGNSQPALRYLSYITN